MYMVILKPYHSCRINVSLKWSLIHELGCFICFFSYFDNKAIRVCKTVKVSLT